MVSAKSTDKTFAARVAEYVEEATATGEVHKFETVSLISLLFLTFFETFLSQTLKDFTELPDESIKGVLNTAFTITLLTHFNSKGSSGLWAELQQPFNASVLWVVGLIKMNKMALNTTWNSCFVGFPLIMYFSIRHLNSSLKLRGLTISQISFLEKIGGFVALCLLFTDAVQPQTLDVSNTKEAQYIIDFSKNYPVFFIDDSLGTILRTFSLAHTAGVVVSITLALTYALKLIQLIISLFLSYKGKYGDGRIYVLINIITNIIFTGLCSFSWISIKAMNNNARRDQAYAMFYIAVIFIVGEIESKLTVFRLTGVRTPVVPLMFAIFWMFAMAAGEDASIQQKLNDSTIKIDWYLAAGLAPMTNFTSYTVNLVSEIKSCIKLKEKKA